MKLRKGFKIFLLFLLIGIIGIVCFISKDKMKSTFAKKEDVKEVVKEKKEDNTLEIEQNKEKEEKQKKYEECMSKPYKMDNLDEEFNNLFNSYQSKNLGISFNDVKNDYTYMLNKDKAYYSGCTVKVFMTIYLLEQAREGKIDLNGMMTYLPEDKHQFSDYMDKHQFYEEIPITKLISYWMSISDNTAYFVAIREIGAETINNYFREKYNIYLPFTNKHPFVGNYTADLADKSLKILYKVLEVDDEYSKLVKDAMYNDVENGFTLDGVRMMHKYGEYDVFHNDIGIYEGEYPYLISVLTTDAHNDYIGVISGVHKDIRNIYLKNLESKKSYCEGID